MNSDARGFKVALVADRFINPTSDSFEALSVLERRGWGVIQLPADWYPPDTARELLAQAAEHAYEFARHGYELVAIGARAGLDEALSAVGVPMPEAVHPADAEELDAFLARHHHARQHGE